MGLRHAPPVRTSSGCVPITFTGIAIDRGDSPRSSGWLAVRVLRLHPPPERKIGLQVSVLQLWVNHHENALSRPIGMAGVPEVKALLETTLDVERDASAAVRAAIGQELGRLVWFDAAWVKAMSRSLFPDDERWLPLRFAAFDAFMLYGWRTDAGVQTIPEEYAAAIRRAGRGRPSRRADEADNRLTDHLMSLYWRGASRWPASRI